jgi:uncharacterized delta-60 repeat protein
MKNKLFLITKYFAVGLFITTMLVLIGCSGSGDNRNPFANNEYNDDSNGSNLSGVLALMGDLLGNNDFTITPAGSLDTSFGTNGKVITDLGSVNSSINDIAIQSDGKIVATGGYDTGSGSYFVLTRYNADGTLDTDFGTNGIVTTDIASSGNAHSTCLAIQSDGKIVVAGWYVVGGPDNDFAVARYNTNGSLDNTFGINGIVTTDTGNRNDYARDIAIQSDGKILVAGGHNTATNTYFIVVRYNTNGSLDTSFDGNSGTGNGIVTTYLGGNGSAQTIVIQSDGKIVAGGYYYNGSGYDFALVRYNSVNGTLDTSFDTDGIVTTHIGTDDYYINALAIQSDGKIVAAGYSNASTDYFVLARYNTNGSLDTGFGTSGIVITSILGNPGDDDEANAIAIQSNGKIVVAGYSDAVGDYTFALARYNTDGSLDTSFGTNGIVTTDIGIGQDLAYALAIQSDGKIVTGGSSNNGTNNDFALVRYWASSTIENLW